MQVLGLMGLALAAGATWIYVARVGRGAQQAAPIPNLGATLTAADWPGPLTVVIPAYNEAVNIGDCVRSVLAASEAGPDQLTVWVVDDQSTDETLALVQTLQADCQDARLRVLAGEPRPAREIWTGKNWACAQGAAQTDSPFLLFLDADVRLQPGAIATTLQILQQENVDLLTFWPTIICGCFGEWLVQPLIASLLLVGFEFPAVNDPASDKVFAVGPFMLFRRTAYDAIGGHRAVANQPVEDVELARRIKQQGQTLRYALGHQLAQVQMYRSFAAVWEGWTKNWHLGSQRNLGATLYSALLMGLVGVVPWVGAAWVLWQGVTTGWSWLLGVSLVLALVAIARHFQLYRAVQTATAIPPRYWWLMPVGSAVVAAIAIASIIKTETGWGWTWRGRPLQAPKQP